MESQDFYNNIPYFSRFSEITDARHYRKVPADWQVVITDVKGSTKAIEAGRYKDVNRIGAAAVVCATKGMDGKDFPYVFGGDGATLVIPPAQRDAVLKELAALKALSEKRFKLGLRVGVVSVQELMDAGAKLEVARFRLAGEKCIGLFRGGGLNEAEKRIKGDEEKYGVAAAEGVPDLDELSCRWNAVPATHGASLSLLVMARSEDHPATYAQVLGGLEQIVEHGLDAANPVQLPAMSYKTWWQCVKDEARHFPYVFRPAFFTKLIGIAVAVISLKYGVNPRFYDPVAYANSIPAHSDYRKFDDALRMILDCTPEQIGKIRAFLEQLHSKGEIFFGLHQAADSLITCYVQNTEEGGHIHFVDGGNGGYAMAAKELKAQIKAG